MVDKLKAFLDHDDEEWEEEEEGRYNEDDEEEHHMERVWTGSSCVFSQGALKFICHERRPE